MRKQYLFGHTCIEAEMPEDMLIPENLHLFETRSEKVQKYYRIAYSQELDQIERKFRAMHPDLREIFRNNMRILLAEGEECRILNFVGASAPYAVYIEEGEAGVRVFVDPQAGPLLKYDTIFVSLLALEKVMIRSEALILHSAYMCLNGKAVLFSAPSGTGKSTQADLWEQYRGTRTINGDKSLLIREEDGWYAHGWPICGSSQICKNETFPILAIVMLKQAKENRVRKLGIAEAVKKLVSQITMNMWNSQFQLQALDLIQQMVMEVPVYELECDISEEAVICLENIL